MKQRAIAQRSLEQLLDHARSGFAALTGREALGPFLPLGGVKMRLHRVVYVWACETAEAPAPIIPAGAGRASAAATSAATLGDGPALRGASRVPFGDAEFLPLAEARSLIEPQQRRFLDQLEGLLTGPAS